MGGRLQRDQNRCSLTSTVRTPEQTEIGYFWGDRGPLLWQNVLRYIVRNYLYYIGDAARMCALADAALADAQIACWESKYFYNFWRPITAIRLGDQDDNPSTEVDPDWQPLINTPNFPEYPSSSSPFWPSVSRFGQHRTSRIRLQINKTASPSAMLAGDSVKASCPLVQWKSYEVPPEGIVPAYRAEGARLTCASPNQ